LTTRARQLPDVGPSPPAAPPPADRATSRVPGPRPRNAKVVVTLLTIATLLAALGTFAALRSDDAALPDPRDQVELLTAERVRLTEELDTATERVVTLTVERDELNGRIADLDAELTTTTADVARLTAERVGLMTERAGLQESLAAAEAEVATLA